MTRRSITLFVLVGACGNPSARPLPATPPTSRNTEATVAQPCEPLVNEPLVNEPEASAPAARRTTFWIRRGQDTISGASPTRAGETPSRFWRRGETRCESMTISEQSIEIQEWLRVIQLRRHGRGQTNVTITFTGSRPLTLASSCDERVENFFDAALANGELFDDLESCRATPNYYSETCHDEECTWEEPRARPFTLPACEEELGALRRRGALVASADHEAVRRSLARLERLISRGGQLYARRGEVCERVIVSPLGHGEAMFRQRLPRTDDDTQTEGWHLAHYVFEPLFGRARRRSDSRLGWVIGNRSRVVGQSSALDARGGPPVVGLALGDGVLLLDSGAFYFQARDCEAAAPLD